MEASWDSSNGILNAKENINPKKEEFIMPFNDTWNFLQENLLPGTEIENWTVDHGYFNNHIKVESLSANRISFSTPTARYIQNVPKDHFRMVYEIWREYNNHQYLWHLIRDNITRYSRYIISSFKWVEDNNNGTLP